MSYFEYFPNVFIGEGVKDDESFKYRLAKNIFRRLKVRDDMSQFITAFETYELGDDELPWTLADTMYGNSGLDWTILLTNNITDFYSQWPKKEVNLQMHVAEMYDDPDAVHHYESYEQKWNDYVIFKKGMEVNQTWRAVLPDGTTKSEEQSVYPVSNYEHEVFLNDKKRFIKLPTPGIVDTMEEELRSMLAYEPHAELDEFNNKKTPLNIAARFLDISGYISGSVNIGDNVGTVTSYDNGPGSTTIKVA